MNKLVRNKLFEDPDTTWAKGSELRWYNSPAHPFGVNKDRGLVIVGKDKQTHSDLAGRTAYAIRDFEGRIWPMAGIISFWKAPSRTVLIHIINNLLEAPELQEYDLKPDDFHDFLFEIPNPDDSSDDEDVAFTLKEYPEDPKSWRAIRRPEHTVSPMLKKGEAPKVGGSEKYAKKKPLKYRQALQTSESMVKESPDSFKNPGGGEFIEWDMVEFLPVTFGWHNGKLYWTDKIIKRRGTDTIRIKNAEIQPNYYGNKEERVVTHSELAEIEDLRYTDDGGNERMVQRRQFKWPGRLWRKLKVISFWEYPEKGEMPEVLKELGDAIGEKIYGSKEWKIETNDFDEFNKRIFVPASEFKGTANYSSDELAKQHVISPMLKKPNTSGPGKLRSKTYPGQIPIKSRDMATKYAYTEGKKEIVRPTLNENPNAILDPKEWEKHKDKPSYTPPKIEFDEKGAVPFGYYGDPQTLVTGGSNQTHMHLVNKAKKMDLIRTAGQFKERGRNSGRLFKEQKVITFWNFPKDYNELQKVVKDLEEKLNIKIDSEWRIEIPSGEFKAALDSDQGSWGSWHPRVGQVSYIPIDQYKGGYKRSKDELEIKHTDNPVEKERKRKLLRKMGKTFTPSKGGFERFKEKYAMGESFYPRLK